MNQTTPVELHRVNDWWIFAFIYPTIALLAIHIGNDNTLKELLRIPSYYSDLLLAFGCVYGIGFYYRWLFYRISQKFDWEMQFQKRILRQVIFGIIFPLTIVIGVELLYLEFILHIPLKESAVFYLELPVIAIFSILINLLYSILYFRLHNLELKNKLELQQQEIHPIAAKEHKTSFIVNIGAKSLHIPEDSVAYFIILERSTFLVTVENQRYLHNSSLEKLREIVNPTRFFQLNRQIVINRKSILSYIQTDTRKLEIEITPKPSERVFVSKIRSPRFLDWLNQR